MKARAIVYCEGGFNTTHGKTAHGLVRQTRRYEVLSVLDSHHAGLDAAAVLDGEPKGIPIFASLGEAARAAEAAGKRATHFVMGLAPDGGRITPQMLQAIREAVALGLSVDSGLHDFITEDPELVSLAQSRGVALHDVRKTPPRSELHSFTGRISEVRSLKVAVLGTDSAVGKRTTAWKIVDAYNEAGISSELIGTGQTAWMQGARYGILLDSLINDFVAGELEHAMVSCWNESRPRVMVIEGQGSLMNPAYPGGLELLAAGRPEAVVVQHAPARKEYDGFPGFLLHPIRKQIDAIELLSGKPVVAVTLNHEGLRAEEIARACRDLERETGLPVCDPLVDGVDRVLAALRPYLDQRSR